MAYAPVEPHPTQPRLWRAARSLLGALALFAALSLYVLRMNPPEVRWDGMFYFSTLRSAYFDRDIDYTNEAQRFPWMARTYGQPLPSGLLSNPFPVGSAILWSPFYAVADRLCHGDPAGQCSGYEPVYVAGVMVGTVFWGTLGLALCALALRSLFPTASPGLAGLAILTVALGTPLLFYLTVDVDYAHGNQFFAVALLLFLTARILGGGSAGPWSGFAYGLAVGLAFLIRWQDLVFGLLAVPVTLALPRHRRWAFALAAGAGLVVGMLPQLLVWRALYGSWLTIPQSGSFLSLANAAPLAFFFSTWNGVFLWHPLVLLALVGLLEYFRRPVGGPGAASAAGGPGVASAVGGPGAAWVALGVAAGLIIVAEVGVSMLALDWWSGGAFGQRRLVSLAPLLCVGMLQIYEGARAAPGWRRALLVALVALLVALNLLTLLRFHQGALPFNPADPSNYLSRQVYGHYDYARRLGDLLTGHKP